MSTSLEERLYARELRAFYRATCQSAEPFTPRQIEAFGARRGGGRGSALKIRSSFRLTRSETPSIAAFCTPEERHEHRA